MTEETQQKQLKLNPEEIAEYRRLKNDSEKQTTIVANKLYNLQQDQDTDRGIVQHESRRLEQQNSKIKEVSVYRVNLIVVVSRLKSVIFIVF